jgi:hypothetical protein
MRSEKEKVTRPYRRRRHVPSPHVPHRCTSPLASSSGNISIHPASLAKAAAATCVKETPSMVPVSVEYAPG